MSRVSIAAAFVAAAAWGQQEIRLWPDQPLLEGEVSTPSKSPKYQGLAANYTVAHNPSIFAFLPGKGNGAAMIVAPGGGHRQLVIEKEGWEIADWLRERGIAAFVLKYRLARVAGVKYTLENEVHADAAEAVRIVRRRAAEWGVDPARIGFIGFSAGGEVAGMIGTKFDAASRPDFNVVVYPGPNRPSPASPFPVPDNAPPTFIVCTTEDRSHAEPSVKLYMDLFAKKVPVELHLYDAGPHGFALRPTGKNLPVDTWADRLTDWLRMRGIVR